LIVAFDGGVDTPLERRTSWPWRNSTYRATSGSLIAAARWRAKKLSRCASRFEYSFSLPLAGGLVVPHQVLAQLQVRHLPHVDFGRDALVDGVELVAEELVRLLAVVSPRVGADELPVAPELFQNVKLPSAFVRL
jgi:hypothetical protein